MYTIIWSAILVITIIASIILLRKPDDYRNSMKKLLFLCLAFTLLFTFIPIEHNRLTCTFAIMFALPTVWLNRKVFEMSNEKEVENNKKEDSPDK